MYGTPAALLSLEPSGSYMTGVLLLLRRTLNLQVGTVKIYPLYSTLPPQQQQKIFDTVSSLSASL